MKALDRFCETASAYSEWCVSPPGSPSEEAQAALQFLQSLQQQAEWLRKPENMDDTLRGKRPDQAAWFLVHKRASALPFQKYQPEAVGKKGSKKRSSRSDGPEFTGDLCENIADVYRDLSEGLSLYAQGNAPEAESFMRSSYDLHWGRHAREACKVLVSWLAKRQT